MQNLLDNREKELNNILSGVKLTSLFLTIILFINQSYTNNINKFGMNINYQIALSGTIICLLFLIYLFWYFFSVKTIPFKFYKLIHVIENFAFFILFSSLIILSNTYASQYKFLYIFIIIISTLQMGMRYGVVMALISSALILILDLAFAPSASTNSFFQSDLVLVGVYLSTAWSLGHYVKFEKETINRKDLHLQVLNKELLEQNKQRRYIEEILFSNESCYNLLFQNSRDAILVHNYNDLIFVNESAATLIGLSKAEDLMGLNFSNFSNEEDMDLIKDKFTQLDKLSINKIIFEERIVRLDGSSIVVQNTSTKFIYEGKPTILSLLHDITSDKQVEQLQRDVEKNIELLNETREFNKFITESFSNISHELKTPLNVMYSAVQVLKLYNTSTEKNIIEKRSNYIKVLKQNCFRLMRLINNFLDMTRFDSGFLKLNLENHNIVSVVENISLSVVSYFEAKGINLTFDTNTEERIMVIDPDKIERIILNLLSNAYKFTNSGGEILVCLTALDDHITICIKDTGIGIATDKLDIIFERFGQVDKTLTRFHEGSGIGLSLVKSFVELHGGTINIKSVLGEGSEFNITLPIRILEEDTCEEVPMYETNIERINIEFSDIYSDSF